jgi:hypothetical protein
MVYFIFEILFRSDKSYISKIISALAQKFSLPIELQHNEDKIIMIISQDASNLEPFLKALESHLPASIYLENSSHRLSETKPTYSLLKEDDLPLDISLCPSCQKEMFDVSSRRYYYPFTSCNACGSQHAFLDKYPFKRENSTMKFLNPCESCKAEMLQNPLRKNYPLISCIECGIALRMVDKKSERYANDKGSYRQLFEVAARAIAKGKRILFQTTHGYRCYFKVEEKVDLSDAILMMADASTLNTHLMLVPQEFNALLSIERPLLRVATKSEEMKRLFGSSLWCKYPDDGMSMLLAKEMMNMGLSYLAYVECDAEYDADMRVGFDIPICTQQDFKLFINQDVKLLISGERSIFPQNVTDIKRGRVSIASGLTLVDGVIDRRRYFTKIPATEILVESKEPLEFDIPVRRFDGFKASMLSVLAEHKQLQEKAIGVHFEDRLHFLYYNEKEVIDVVPPRDFEGENLFEKIAELREGSDRLVENFKKEYPSLYLRLSQLDEGVTLFDVAAILLELEEESFEGISSKALEFMGKGGLQIDTKVEDNRFNDYAFLASLMSYKLTGAENGLLCYSIYESFGDYIAEIVTQLSDKTKAKRLVLSGTTFANQSLWGRIVRNLGHKKPLLNINYPIGKENQVYGANYL